MGGKGSGGRRLGAGRKLKSALERAISGAPARGKVVHHPNSPVISTAVAPVVTFDPPAGWLGAAAELETATSQLRFLEGASRPDEPNPQIAELQARVADLGARVLALGIWQELAPHAFEKRTLTPATAAAFEMLCRARVKEQALSASWSSCGGPDHRGLMHRVAAWLTSFDLAPIGKPLYAAEPVATTNPLDRFTKKARA